MKPILSNFIPINRNLFKHELWLQKRAYSRFEAWLDLLATARFDNSPAQMLVGCTVVRWNRGELVASLRYLCTRWGWSKTKVENFFKLLKHEGMIKTRTAEGTVQTIVSICNYDIYNTTPENLGHQHGQYEANTQTPQSQPEDKTNKANNQPINNNKQIYRSFGHLILYTPDFLNLLEAGYKKTEIDTVLDAIENYKNNKKYASLYLTAKKWLQNQNQVAGAAAGPGRIVNIASAFNQALKHGVWFGILNFWFWCWLDFGVEICDLFLV